MSKPRKEGGRGLTCVEDYVEFVAKGTFMVVIRHWYKIENIDGSEATRILKTRERRKATELGGQSFTWVVLMAD